MTSEGVPVTQADIKATEALDDALGFLTDKERPLVLQAFARHRIEAERSARLASTQAPATGEVERVARAICSGNVTYNGPKDDRTQKQRIDEEWVNWTDDAKAAIAALRTPASPFPREEVAMVLDRARDKIGHVSIDAMKGDNLAVTLCSAFDDPDAEQDENGWSEAAVTGCDAALAAIHEVYVSQLAALLQRSGKR